MVRNTHWTPYRRWVSIVCLVLAGGFVVGYRSLGRTENRTLIPRAKWSFGQGLRPADLRAVFAGLEHSQLKPNATPEPLESAILDRTTAGGRLIFAHIADGALGGGRFMRTSLTLVNSTIYGASGTLYFYDSGGNPLTLTIGSQTRSSFPVSLASQQSLKLTTSGAGAPKSGWAALYTDQPVLGACSFSTRDAAGTIYSDVGVEESLLSSEFTLFADSVGAANTGVALVNPDAQQSLSLTLELFDTAAALKKTKPIQLGPREHFAQFLTELFQGTSGINEFRGSIRIRGTRPFAGITLRTLDTLLTSVPMVPPPDLRANRNRLIFPQLADGLEGGFRISTTVVLFNNTTRAVSGSIDFISPSGGPLSLKVGSAQSATYAFSLPPAGVYHLQTQGAGPIKTGWADVRMDGPIDGAVIYHIFDSAGRTLTEVGVRAAGEHPQQSVLADSMGPYRTGMALANVSEEDDIEVSLDLLNAAGAVLATHKETLAPLQQISLFVEDLFKSVSGIQEFQGRVVLSSDDPYVAMTLRQAGILTTSVPVIPHVGGFGPTSELEFQQTLVGTSPALRWHFRQPALDLALDRLRVSLPNLGLRPNQIHPGDEIAYGTVLFDYAGNSQGGIMKLIASEDSAVTGSFNAVIAMAELGTGIVLFSGTLSGQAQSGFLLEIGPNEAPNCDASLAGLDLDLILKDGLIQAPAQAASITATTQSYSASTKYGEDGVPVLQTTRQTIAFQALGAGIPALTQVRPLFFTPGTRLLLQGANLGAGPEVVFSGENSSIPADLPSVNGNTIEVFAPPGAVSGALRVTQGSVSGPSFLMKSLFNPWASLQKSGSGAFTLAFDLEQGPGELGMQSFELRLSGVGWPTTLPDGAGRIGTLTVTGGTTAGDSTAYDLRIRSSSSSSMVVGVREAGEDGDYATIQLTRPTQTAVAFRFLLESVPDLPVVYGHARTIHLGLSGLRFTTSDQTRRFWTAEATSLASQLIGSETGIPASLGTWTLQ